MNNSLIYWANPYIYWSLIQFGIGLSIFGRGAALSGYNKTGNVTSYIGVLTVLISTGMLLVSNIKLSMG